MFLDQFVDKSVWNRVTQYMTVGGRIPDIVLQRLRTVGNEREFLTYVYIENKAPVNEKGESEAVTQLFDSTGEEFGKGHSDRGFYIGFNGVKILFMEYNMAGMPNGKIKPYMFAFNATIKDKASEFGKNNMPRPRPIKKIPTDADPHTGKGYELDLIDDADEVTSIFSWIGATNHARNMVHTLKESYPGIRLAESATTSTFGKLTLEERAEHKGYSSGEEYGASKEKSEEQSEEESEEESQDEEEEESEEESQAEAGAKSDSKGKSKEESDSNSDTDPEERFGTAKRVKR